MKKLYFLNESERKRISELHNSNVKEKYLINEKELLVENPALLRLLLFLMTTSRNNPNATVNIAGRNGRAGSFLMRLLANPIVIGIAKTAGLIGLAYAAWELFPGKVRPEEASRNSDVYENYVIKCEYLINDKTMDDSEITTKANKIYDLIGKVMYHITPDQANYLKAEIERLNNAGNYCAVDKKFIELVRTKGTGSSWDSSGYNYLHEIVSHVFYYNSAFDQSFVNPLSYLKGWGRKRKSNETSTSNKPFWTTSNLTENPSTSNVYNCVISAYKENSSPFRGGNAKYLDKKFLKDIKDSSKLSNLYYYYGKELRYFSDGKWQDRKNPSIYGEYRCGPGVGLEAIILSGKKEERGNDKVVPTPISVDCTKMGETDLTMDKLNNLRILIGSSESGSSLSQKEINLIYNKII